MYTRPTEPLYDWIKTRFGNRPHLVFTVSIRKPQSLGVHMNRPHEHRPPYRFAAAVGVLGELVARHRIDPSRLAATLGSLVLRRRQPA